MPRTALVAQPRALAADLHDVGVVHSSRSSIAATRTRSSANDAGHCVNGRNPISSTRRFGPITAR
jgi:hypothetical protein